MENKDSLDIETWAQKLNPYMKEIKQRQPKIYDTIKSAMKSYSNRILTRLMFTPNVKINDNINGIVNYVASFPKFIDSLLINDELKISPPFCVCKSYVFLAPFIIVTILITF